MMRRKKAEEQDAPTTGDARVAPMDVQQVEFRLAFRGYNERDVDAFLDRVTEDLASYIEENQRLRAGGAVAAASVDTSAPSAEAERIVADARAEAARIVREAEARAAAAGAASGDTRAAVAPFLNTEREFLQSLGSLVQGHAEEIKQMVLALRARAEGASAAAQAAVAPSAPSAPAASAPADQEPVRPEETVRADKDDRALEAEEAFAPIKVPGSDEVAAEEREPDPEPASAQLRGDPGERSLRELFWGED